MNSQPSRSTEAVPVIERRTVARYAILQRCFVWPHGSAASNLGGASLYNISSNGLGITMPFPPQPGTVFQVEAWGLPGARPLEIRVLRTIDGRIPLVLRLRISSAASPTFGPNFTVVDTAECRRTDPFL